MHGACELAIHDGRRGVWDAIMGCLVRRIPPHLSDGRKRSHTFLVSCRGNDNGSPPFLNQVSGIFDLFVERCAFAGVSVSR